jgi:diguanylate cyclase (GGDEF)-like protein
LCELGKLLTNNYEFLKAIVDASMDSIVVIEPNGDFVFTNHSWHDLGRVSSWFPDGDWKGCNYLKACDVAAVEGDRFALQAADGIRKVSRAEQDVYYLEYPCDKALNSRWFLMRVSQFVLHQSQYLVISHHEITARKLAEEEAKNLAHVDDLTGIANRRRFEEFLRHQWRRSARMKTPISLAMIDIDHFKQVNDTYGHGIGDKYLKFLSSLFARSAQRPDDICARFGGEEFTLVLGSTASEGAVQVLQKLMKNVRNLKIPNENADTTSTLTLSIGLATMYPDQNNQHEDLLLSADKLLYSAKSAGRDAIAVSAMVLNPQVLDVEILSTKE